MVLWRLFYQFSTHIPLPNTVGTHSWCSTLFRVTGVQAILFRVPRFWRGFRAMVTGLKLSHQQIRRWWCETDYTWVGRLRGNCIWVCLECSWIVRSKRETERLPRVFWEAAIHHQCSKLNCHMQDFTLFLATKSAAAAPPPHGEEEGRQGGACCYVSVFRVCGKMLTSYLWKEIERLDAFYAGRSTSSRLLCDQTT